MRYRAKYVPKKTEESSGNGSSSDSNDRGGDTPVTPPPTPKTLYKIYGASKESETPLTKDDVHFLDEMETSTLLPRRGPTGVFRLLGGSRANLPLHW